MLPVAARLLAFDVRVLTVGMWLFLCTRNSDMRASAPPRKTLCGRPALRR